MRTIHSNSLILPPLSIAILVSSYSIGFTKSERMSTRIKSYVHGNTVSFQVFGGWPKYYSTKESNCRYS